MSQSPDNLDPNASSTPTPRRDDSLLDAFVDEQLHGEERTAFEARIDREAALGDAYHRQRAIDASLRRLFPQPTIDGHADRVLERAMAQLPPETMSAEHNGHATLDRAAAAATIALRDRAETSTKRRREPLLRGWMKVAAIITLLIGVPAALWLWRDTFISAPDPYAHAKAVALDDLYREQVAAGFKPEWVCNDQQEFASYFAGRFGQPLMIHDATAGAAMLGLSYTGGVTQASMGMLGTADGKDVLIVVDRADNDGQMKMSHPDGLKLFRRKIGSLMLYEVTPLDQPRLLEMFYQPETPTSAQASAGCK
jgi:hypothetical protein